MIKWHVCYEAGRLYQIVKQNFVFSKAKGRGKIFLEFTKGDNSRLTKNCGGLFQNKVEEQYGCNGNENDMGAFCAF